jgi:sugar lactone lactonase YvrE
VHSMYAIALPALFMVTGPTVIVDQFAGEDVSIPTIPTLQPPGPPTTGIVAAADGTVYFVDSYHNTVWRMQPGRGTTAFVTGRNGRSLQIDDEGNIYGTHRDGGRLRTWRADGLGNVVEVTRTEVPEQSGHAFILDEDGELIGWTGANRRSGIRLWRAREHQRHLVAGGEWGYRDGSGVQARFQSIGGMALTSDGELLVTSGATVRRVGADGSVSTIAAGDPLLKPRGFLARLVGDGQGHLTGIAEGDDGSIYVANTGRGAVVRIDPDGSTQDIATSANGWMPTGVASAHGALYILEYGTGVRVRRITSDGASSIVAHVRPDRGLAAALGRTPVRAG